MNASLTLRTLRLADLEFAHGLGELIGWNQTLQDWRRLLAHEPDGCFVAEWEGSPAGTATTTCYGSELAWIGMVLVHPEYRRRGIGKALLHHCLEYLAGRGIRCIKLDATPLGKPLYEQLGFREEWALTRWQKDSSKAGEASKTQSDNAPAQQRAWRAWTAADNAFVAKFDKEVFGVSREKMLEALAAESAQALILSSETGVLAGFGMHRAGSKAAYLGPIVAASDEAGQTLIRELLLNVRQPLVYWDIPDANLAAVSLAKELGFTPQRSLLRMHLGPNENPGRPDGCFGIADPAIG